MADVKTSLTLDDSGYLAGAQRVVAADKAIVDAHGKVIASTDAVSAGTIAVSETQRQIVPALTGSSAAFDRLRQKTDDTYRTSLLLAKATRDADAAVRAGRATQEVASATLAAYKLELAGGAAAARVGAAAVEGLASAHEHGRGSAARMREGLVLVHEFLRGDWKRAVGSATIELQNFGAAGLLFNPVTLGLVAVAAGAALVASAVAGTEASMAKLGLALKATGEATGLTRGQLEALAQSTSATTTLSVRDVRAVETELVAGGRIGGQVLTRLVGLTSDYAKVTGESSEKAAASLNKLFTDPMKGAKELDAAYNLLTDSQLKDIETAQRGGDIDRARTILLDALAQRIKGASDQLGFFAHAWEMVGKVASNTLDTLGRNVGTSNIDPGRAQVLRSLSARQSAELGARTGGGTLVGAAELRESGLAVAQENDQIRASFAATAAQDRDSAKAALEIVNSYDKLGDAQRRLSGEQGRLQALINAGKDVNGDYKRSLDAIYAAQLTTISADKEAQRIATLDADVNAVALNQRDALKAKLDAEHEAVLQVAAGHLEIGKVQDFVNARVAPILDRQRTALRDQSDEIRKQIGLLGSLAAAYGVSLAAASLADARRKATLEQNRNPAVNVEARTLEILRLGTAENLDRGAAGNLEQRFANDNLRLVAGAGTSPAAVEAARRQAEINAAFRQPLATAQAAVDAGGGEAAQKQLDLLKQQADAHRDLLKIRDDENRLIRSNDEVKQLQQSVEELRLEASLIDQSVEKRTTEIALLKLRHQLINEGYPDQSSELDAELERRKALTQEAARLTAVIDIQKQRERDFQAIAREGINAITTGIEDAILSGKRFVDVARDLEKAFLRLALTAVNKGINTYIDKQIGSGGAGGAGGLFGLFGAGGGGWNPISGTNGLGGLFGFGGALSGSAPSAAIAEGLPGAGYASDLGPLFLAHNGGMAGDLGRNNSSRVVSMAAFRNAPRHHTGFAPDEVPAILLKNERVLSPEQTRTYNAGIAAGSQQGGGGTTIHVSPTVVINGKTSQEDHNRARQSASQIAQDAARLLARSQRRSG